MANDDAMLVCCLRPVSSTVHLYEQRERCRTIKNSQDCMNNQKKNCRELWLSVCSSATVAAAAAAKTINVCANTQSFTYLSHCGKPLFAIITIPLNGSLIMMIMILISGLVTPVSSAFIRRRLSCFFSLLIALTCLAPNLTSISQLPIINCVQTRFSQG